MARAPLALAGPRYLWAFSPGLIWRLLGPAGLSTFLSPILFLL